MVTIALHTMCSLEPVVMIFFHMMCSLESMAMIFLAETMLFFVFFALLQNQSANPDAPRAWANADTPSVQRLLVCRFLDGFGKVQNRTSKS